jgi:hypothetical protein
MNKTPLVETSTKFLALVGSKHITQAPAHCCSILSTCANEKTVVGVLRNGVSLKFRTQPDGSVAVSPLLSLQGDRIELLCIGPQCPSGTPKPHPATTPFAREARAAPLVYGLQSPSGTTYRTT